MLLKIIVYNYEIPYTLNTRKRALQTSGALAIVIMEAFMTITQYILVTLLVLLTLFNLYNLTLGRKKKSKATKDFKQTLAELEHQTYKEMKKRSLLFTEKHGYINDTGAGILLTFDHKKEIMGITLKDEFYAIPYNQVLSCTPLYDTLENKKWTNIRVELETEDLILTLQFASKPWRANSSLARFIVGDSEELCSFVTRYCIEGERPETLQETEKATSADKQ